jgi:hypothetical protein
MQQARTSPIDVAYIWFRYFREHGRAPRLFHPVRYSEKIEWRKLFDFDPLHPVVADKLAMRAFVAEKVGAGALIPLLWMGDDPEEIPFENFAEPYVLKCTHGNKMNVFIDDPARFDEEVVRAELSMWLNRNHGKLPINGHGSIRPRIMAEPLLRGTKDHLPVEYRFLMFEGQTALIGVRGDGHHQPLAIVQMRPDWTPAPPAFGGPAEAKTLPARPKELDEMASIAGVLSKHFDHIRIDFLLSRGKLFVSELTPCPDGGPVPPRRDEFDLWMGELWRIEDPAERAFSALLGRRDTVA